MRPTFAGFHGHFNASGAVSARLSTLGATRLAEKDPRRRQGGPMKKPAKRSKERPMKSLESACVALLGAIVAYGVFVSIAPIV
jgi:hypothetical protein